MNLVLSLIFSVRAAESSNQRVKEVEAKRGTSTKMQKLNELKLQREKKKQVIYLRVNRARYNSKSFDE